MEEPEAQANTVANDVRAVTSDTLAFVCIFMVAAILAGAFWGYTLWKRAQGGMPYTTLVCTIWILWATFPLPLAEQSHTF